MTNFPDELVKQALKSFNSGIVRVRNPNNPRGFTDKYLPEEAMQAAIRAAWPMFCDMAAEHFCPPGQMVTGAQREVRDELRAMKEKCNGS